MSKELQENLKQRLRDARERIRARNSDEFFALSDARSKAHEALFDADRALNKHFVEAAEASATFDAILETYEHLYGSLDSLAPTISNGDEHD